MTRIEKNVLLSTKTSFAIGGPADTIVYPETTGEIAEWIVKEGGKIILGGGTNLLVADAGVRQTVLCLRNGFHDVEITDGGKDGVIVRAQSGINLTRLAVTLMKESITGLEFGYGIPGFLGGAIVMNAGAYEGEMKDVLETVTVVTADGKIKKLNRDECGFEYRSSRFPPGCVITEAGLRLRKGNKQKIREKMRRIHMERKAKQPFEFKSAGSIYKNPPGDFAGRLIEQAGLKGESCGDAQVSEKHANFIVNRGGAKAKEVLELMEKIEAMVMEKFGVKLEREILLVGEF